MRTAPGIRLGGVMLAGLLLFAGLLLLTGCAPRTPRPTPPPSTPPAAPALPEPVPAPPVPSGKLGAGFQVAGYHVWWMGDAWRDYDFGVLDQLFYFELRVDEDGQLTNLRGWPHEELLSRARRAGTSVVPTLSMQDPEAFDHLFQSSLRRELLFETTMNAVRVPGVGGVHLDFEILRPVSAEAREGFHRYVERLRRALDAERPGLQLSLFMLAVDHGEVYDEARLARVADALVVQGYDIHWAGGDRAGPVAPVRGGTLNWSTILGRYLAAGIPRSKLFFSVPFYGYEWPTATDRPGSATRGRATTVTYAPVDTTVTTTRRASALARSEQHGLRRDGASGSPYYVYRDDAGWRQGWFDDAESLNEKLEFVRREGLGGIAFFPLGYDDGILIEEVRAWSGG